LLPRGPQRGRACRCAGRAAGDVNAAAAQLHAGLSRLYPLQFFALFVTLALISEVHQGGWIAVSIALHAPTRDEGICAWASHGTSTDRRAGMSWHLNRLWRLDGDREREVPVRTAVAVLLGVMLLAAGCGGGSGGNSSTGAGGQDGGPGPTAGPTTPPSDGGSGSTRRNWWVPPAGPTSPTNNEDLAYRDLAGSRLPNESVPPDCGSLLSSAPSTSFLSEKHRYLFVAGANACLGRTSAAAEAFDRSERYQWLSSIEGSITATRMCAVHQALIGYLKRPARPCGIRVGPDETTPEETTPEETTPEETTPEETTPEETTPEETTPEETTPPDSEPETT
jgi:hypothetical protein